MTDLTRDGMKASKITDFLTGSSRRNDRFDARWNERGKHLFPCDQQAVVAMTDLTRDGMKVYNRRFLLEMLRRVAMTDLTRDGMKGRRSSTESWQIHCRNDRFDARWNERSLVKRISI